MNLYKREHVQFISIYRWSWFFLQLREISRSEQATTPVDPRVLDAMLPYFTEQFGNPHSRTHAYGWEAEQAVETGRKVKYRRNGLMSLKVYAIFSK